jgi:probable rRNA maturation factor
MAKLLIDNQTKTKIKKKLLSNIKKAICPKQAIELLFVDDERIREINLEFRDKDSSTDVLSFPASYEFADFLGSIVISIDTASRQALEFNHSLENEIQILFLHGILHLQGMDHETDSGEMRQKEADICSMLGLSFALIERNT